MTQIEIRHLRCFIAVAEEGSYRKAAARLRIAQPALSRTIQQLEWELETQLLERTTRNVQMTDTGRLLLAEARTVLAALGAAIESIDRLRRGQKGELFVGFNDFTISEILPPVIQRFRDRYPQVTVTLIDETSPHMLDMVIRNELDIGFLSGMSPPAELEQFVLREERFVAVLPANHALRRKRRIMVRDLAEQPFVMGVPAWGVFLEAVHQYCERAGFRPNVVQTAHHSDGIVNFVAAGIGVSIYVDRRWLRGRDDITVKPLSGPKPAFQSLAVWRRTNPSASLRNLIAVMREVLAQ